MQVVPSAIPDVLIITPKIHGDMRGFFFESFNERDFHAATGFVPIFIQDNHSRSSKGILRGLHYQLKKPQGKLVRVVRGAVYDVVVDMRASSPTFGKYVGTELSEENHRQVWVPPGFAHGFLTLTDSAEFLYKTTEYYVPEDEHCIAWNDPDINIAWPLTAPPKLSLRDAKGVSFASAATF
jgi:dTDP-4-dehydrorhamnose 3,5-epimerase